MACKACKVMSSSRESGDCDVGLGWTTIEPLSLTRSRSNQEKHVSLNLRLWLFSKLKGERTEKNANCAQSHINWDLTENLKTL